MGGWEGLDTGEGRGGLDRGGGAADVLSHVCPLSS